ncbi:hypothetical protein [Phytohalomonas tamaricis]|uniref:hypothetical protein n=1 Tax=Phytohalomonas tamaricis TaxID=2081032 RepID=UPI000D0B8860|nr:hypothetical protein [Phytohalomonas tamaricis]
MIGGESPSHGSTRGFTKGQMNREGGVDRHGNHADPLFEPGDRPGHAGEFQECDQHGQLLSEDYRIQLDYDDEPLPPTHEKGYKWRMMN